MFSLKRAATTIAQERAAEVLDATVDGVLPALDTPAREAHTHLPDVPVELINSASTLTRRVLPGAPNWPDSAHRGPVPRNPATIAPFTATGRTLPTERLCDVSRS